MPERTCSIGMRRVDHKAFDLARDTPTTDLVDNPRLAM